MPVSCQDCGAHFLLSNADVVNGPACECGSTRLERDQPSPTHSDGELRDMVDPGTGLDQGGNPLQEGTLGDYQNRNVRDQSFASVVRPRFNNMEPYMPWAHESQTKEALGIPGALADALPFAMPEVGIPALAGKLLLGQAAGGLLKGVFKGFGNDQPSPQVAPVGAPGMPPPVAKTADLETPTSYPELHDDPDGDPHEFHDQDMSPNFENPNLNGDGGSDTLEDGVKQKLEFHQDDPILNDISDLLPRLLDAYHSPESGLNDPVLRGLHEKIEAQHPGYLDQSGDDDESVQQLLQAIKQPQGVTAASPAMDDVRQFGKQQSVQQLAQQLMAEGYNFNEANRLAWSQIQYGQGTPDTVPQHWAAAPMPGAAGTYGTLPGVNPNGANAALPGQMPAGGHCANCGGTLNADGTCSQCGFNNVGQQPGGNQSLPNLGQPGIQAPQIQTNRFAAIDDLSDQDLYLMMADAKQKMDESYMNYVRGGDLGEHMKWGREYHEIADAIARRTGQEPRPGMDLPEGVGDHYRNLSKVAADHQGPITDEQKAAVAELLIQSGRHDEVPQMLLHPELYIDELEQVQGQDNTQPPTVDPNEQPPAQPAPMDPSMMQGAPPPGAPMGGQMAMSKTAADSYTPRCPRCNSATTGVINDRGDCRCHSCNHMWNKEAVPAKIGRTWTKKADAPGLAPSQVPDAADSPDGMSTPDQSTVTWQDTDGAPLEVGQTYEMHSNLSQVPDMVRVETVKPDGITVTIVTDDDPNNMGGADPNAVHDISNDELQSAGLTFVPSTETGDQDPGEGPGQTINTEPVQTPDVPGVHASVEPDRCPSCNYTHITSSMTSPTTKMWECHRCANQWPSHEEEIEADVDLDSRDWLNEDSSPIEFDERMLAMASAGKSRNISDIAAKDPRHEAVRSMLNKEAGKKFTPKEQKEFIDEEGTARNADLLDLAGTHYEIRQDHLVGARPDRVDDNYLGFL